MNSEDITTGTWLPVFPGFYGTLFDGENMYEQEIDYVNEHVQPKDLAVAMVENLYNSNAGTKLWKDYTLSIAKQCTDIIERELKSLGFVQAIKCEDISSPKEYNFRNDSINIEVIFSADNIDKIKTFIQEHLGEWKTYIRENFSSYDGFISFHSNSAESEEWQIHNALNDSHNAGAVLTFLCGENNINEETLYYGCNSEVQLDHDMLIKECIESGWYVPDTWWNRLKSKWENRYPRFRRIGSWCAMQYVMDTRKFRYVFAVTKADVTNKDFKVYRLFKIFVFGRLENAKEKNT